MGYSVSMKIHWAYVFVAGLAFAPLLFSCDAHERVSLREKQFHEKALETYRALQTQKREQEQALIDFLHTRSPVERISQLFLVNIDGDKNYRALETVAAVTGKPEDAAVPLVPGGCLFFSYNIAPDASGLMDFTDSIHDFCARYNLVAPYCAVDQEGGIVNRLRDITSALPSAMRVSELFTPEDAMVLYRFQAEQMAALGFHMNLAPVAEVLTEENEPFLGNRSFGGTGRVVSYCMAELSAFSWCGLGAVLKHFPGNTDTDPHTGLPEIALDAATVESTLVAPFAALVHARPAGILMSHARVKAYDGATPSCLSSAWVRDVLRDRLGFEGLVISDDIFMAALAENGFPPRTASVQAVRAGVDVIMLSEKYFAPVVAMLLEEAERDESFALCLELAERNVLRYKIAAGLLEWTRGGEGWELCVAGRHVTREKRLDRFLTAKAEGQRWYESHRF